MLNILLVDDDPLVRDTLGMGLEDYCSAMVVCSNNGASAIEAMQHHRLDAMITDVDLPDFSGLELAERAANQNIPTLLVPGHADAVAVCVQYNYPLLAKPFLPSTLAEETLRIIRSAEKNVAQVRASSQKLKATAAGLAEAIAEARRLVAQTTLVIARNTSAGERPAD